VAARLRLSRREMERLWRGPTPGRAPDSEIEQLAEEGFAAPSIAIAAFAALAIFSVFAVLAALAIAALAPFAVAVATIRIGIAHRRGRRRHGRCRAGAGRRPLDDLVEFAAIEPHAATGRAIVDLDPLAFGHH